VGDDLPETTGQNSLPVPYVTSYTNRTLTIVPLLLTTIKVWAVAMLEWGSLRFIDHAPISVWISSSAIAGLVLVVLEKREWLNFKNRRYFPVSITILMLIWFGIVGVAYYVDGPLQALAKQAGASAPEDIDAVNRRADDAFRQLIGALNERDTAKRDLANAKHDLELARANTPQQLSLPPPDSAPLAWDHLVNWPTFGTPNGGQEIKYVILTGRNPSNSAVQLKDAYLISAVTGERLPLLVDAGAEGIFPISQMNAIPHDAQINLRGVFEPPLSVREFADRWMRLSFKAEYDSTLYSENFDLETRLRNYPELKLGPRVTRKQQ
jgi:hypothetical protein